jgi:hypothetical protein
MSVLGKVESRISGLVEGAFSRAFRSEVRPIEIARKLIREMDRNRTVSVSRTYAPNHYMVYLSPPDYRRLINFQDALVGELAGYLLEHARREDLALLTQPQIEFRSDRRLSLGTFGIQARVMRATRATQAEVDANPPRERQREQPLAAETSDPAPGRTLVRREAWLLFDGKQVGLNDASVVVGRSNDCEVVLPDPNVSRHHAKLTQSGEDWLIEDLGSTNGVVINGEQVHQATVLTTGDQIELGNCMLRFETDRG